MSGIREFLPKVDHPLDESLIERPTGVGPVTPAWEASIIPINYGRQLQIVYRNVKN